MTGSVTAVFAACAAATGRPFQPPARGTTTRCPLHDDGQASLSLREDRGTFRCFAASCIASSKSAQLPGFGIVDVPIAFGIVADRTAASTWLSDRNLIPPPAGSSRALRTPVPRPRRTYTDSSTLPPLVRLTRLEALLDLFKAVGGTAMRRGQAAIAEMRAAREDALAATEPYARMYAAIATVLASDRLATTTFEGQIVIVDGAGRKRLMPSSYVAILTSPEVGTNIVARARALDPEAFAAVDRIQGCAP